MSKIIQPEEGQFWVPDRDKHYARHIREVKTTKNGDTYVAWWMDEDCPTCGTLVHRHSESSGYSSLEEWHDWVKVSGAKLND